MLDNENTETPGFTVFAATGLASATFSGAGVSDFTGFGVEFWVATVSAFFSAGALSSVIEKVGFL